MSGNSQEVHCTKFARYLDSLILVYTHTYGGLCVCVCVCVYTWHTFSSSCR